MSCVCACLSCSARVGGSRVWRPGHGWLAVGVSKITKPATSRLVSVDKKLVTKVVKEGEEDTLEEFLKMSIVEKKAFNMFNDTPSKRRRRWLASAGHLSGDALLHPHLPG